MKRPPREKRELLDFLVSNSSWKNGEVRVTFRKPFDLLMGTNVAYGQDKVLMGAERASKRNWPGKKVSNRIWKNKTDKDARIAKMKNGSTRMAYKAEHAADVDSGVTVAAEVHGADQEDSATMAVTASRADEAVMRVGIAGGMTEVVADRGYHADEVIEKLQTMGLRTCIAEKKQKRNWKAVARRVGQEKMRRLQEAFRRNHRRVRSAAGRAL